MAEGADAGVRFGALHLQDINKSEAAALDCFVEVMLDVQPHS